MTVIDLWKGPLPLVVFLFAFCFLLLTWSIAGINCCVCHSSGTFFHCDIHTRAHARAHARANMLHTLFREFSSLVAIFSSSCFSFFICFKGAAWRGSVIFLRFFCATKKCRTQMSWTSHRHSSVGRANSFSARAESRKCCFLKHLSFSATLPRGRHYFPTQNGWQKLPITVTLPLLGSAGVADFSQILYKCYQRHTDCRSEMKNAGHQLNVAQCWVKIWSFSLFPHGDNLDKDGTLPCLWKAKLQKKLAVT